MRVFVTGATGFVGSAVVPELIAAGHKVLGLARSDAGAGALTASGAEVHRGELQDLESLRRGAAACDGVIHTAFIHDFSKFAENGEIDRRAIEALGTALAGSGRALIVTSGTALLAPGRLATEDDVAPSGEGIPRVSEAAAFAFSAKGVRVSAVRLAPAVHGTSEQGFKAGFASVLAEIARDKGQSAYVGEGHNRWTAVHRLDAARLYRLALEKGEDGGCYHGVGEEEVAFRDIAQVIGGRLAVPVVSKSPEEAAEHFGWFTLFASVDIPASSRLTQERLGWRPEGPALIADLERALPSAA